MCREEKNICCYLDNEGKILQIFVLDNKNGGVKVFDIIKNCTNEYSKSDIDALHHYKYYPDAIHMKLRYGKDKFSGDYQHEILNAIEDLKRLFSDETKVMNNIQNRTIYRALQGDLTEKEMANLETIGAIFEEKSFCSTTEDLNVAKRFASGNPILEIDFPKGAKYIDIEKIFNIDRQHWNEAELLLDKNSKFQIVDVDGINNIVKVKYLV